MQLFTEIAGYDILSTYSEGVQHWIRLALEKSHPLSLSWEAQEWLNTVSLPFGDITDFDFSA